MNIYYEILGLSRNASKNDIKNAFRKKIKENHPDRFNEPFKKELAEEKTRDIIEAYKILLDEFKGKNYYNNNQN